MLTSCVTVKGQVTIPAELRARLGIRPGDRVGFVEANGQIVLQRQETAAASVFGLVKASRGVSLEQMDATVAAGWKRNARA